VPFGVIVVSHGELAWGLVEAAEMIAGPQQDLVAVGLRAGETPESFAGRLAEAWDTLGGGPPVVLVDMQGGTPANVLATFWGKRPFYALAGVNLPVLLEVLLGRPYGGPGEVASQALAAGRGAVVDLAAEFSRQFGDLSSRNN